MIVAVNGVVVHRARGAIGEGSVAVVYALRDRKRIVFVGRRAGRHLVSNSPQQPGIPGGSVCDRPGCRTSAPPPGRRPVCGDSGTCPEARRSSDGTDRTARSHSSGSPPVGRSSGPTRPSQKSGAPVRSRTPCAGRLALAPVSAATVGRRADADGQGVSPAAWVAADRGHNQQCCREAQGDGQSTSFREGAGHHMLGASRR